MAGTNELALVGTGVGLGVVHVLTGPDHLSALATLSAVSDFCTSFCLGVRWGLGHSTGLLLVGVILILRDYNKDPAEDDSRVIDVPDGVSHFFESLVGVFMLFLGGFGLRRAIRKKKKLDGRIEIPSANVEVVPVDVDADAVARDTPSTGREDLQIYHYDPHHDEEARLDQLTEILEDNRSTKEMGPQPSSSVTANANSDSAGPATSHALHGWGFFLSNSRRSVSARSMAVFAGIIHGLAGPGGVLGVIPAVQLHDWKLATLYLSCFCLSSTLTMGCFATCYGVFSAKLGRRTHLEYQIHLFSACLSIFVGLLWLLLIALGKLDEVFP